MDRLEAAFFDIPVVTRTWGLLVAIVSLLCHLKILSPYHLYFDWDFIIHAKQYWRLFSSFFYFGSFGLDFLFHMFFLIRYCQLLEEGSFREKPADFFLLLNYSAISIILIAIAVPGRHLVFLSAPLTFVIVYIWARRNPFVRMSFLGVFNFQAPFLPWVLVAFSMVLHGLPVSDLVGIVVGHVYWYFEDIYPRMLDSQGRHRRRIFQPSGFIMDLFGQARPIDDDNEPPPQQLNQVNPPEQNRGYVEEENSINAEHNLDNGDLRERNLTEKDSQLLTDQNLNRNQSNSGDTIGVSTAKKEENEIRHRQVGGDKS